MLAAYRQTTGEGCADQENPPQLDLRPIQIETGRIDVSQYRSPENASRHIAATKSMRRRCVRGKGRPPVPDGRLRYQVSDQTGRVSMDTRIRVELRNWRNYQVFCA
ncbi:hypothetical protein ACWDWO_21440 [Actinopolymorpha singaporensis]